MEYCPRKGKSHHTSASRRYPKRVPEIITLITVALLGILVGALGVGSYRVSQAHNEEAARVESESTGLSPDALAILTALPTISIVVDSQGSILRADAAAYAKGLVAHDELACARITDLVEKSRETGIPQKEEMELPRSSFGAVASRDFSVRVSPLPRGYSLILVEDTSLQRRNAASRRDFTANVSHELKTPIGALRLLAETIAQHPDDAEAITHFAPKLVRETDRLANLVTDIIDLSRLETPDPLAEPSLVDIDGVVALALEREQETARAAHVELLGPSITSAARVWGDQDMLVTAVRNLIDNAVRYSDQGSSVSVGITVEDELVNVSVVDSGVGIGEDEQERIFERFYRIDPARSRNTGGTGLGLSIVKHVALDHGGTVTVCSRPAKGSTFTLVLPEATTGADGIAEGVEDMGGDSAAESVPKIPQGSGSSQNPQKTVQREQEGKRP